MTQTSKKSLVPESLSWGFFCIVLVLSLGPAVWYFWQLSYGGSAKFTAVALGFTAAAIAAGFVTWLANAGVQLWHEWRRKAESKAKKKSGGKS